MFREVLIEKKPVMLRWLVRGAVAALALGAVGLYTGKSVIDLIFPPAKIKPSRWPGRIVLPSDPPSSATPVLTPSPHRSPQRVSAIEGSRGRLALAREPLTSPRASRAALLA